MKPGNRKKRPRTCRGKVRYRDQQDALRTIRGLKSDSRRAKVPSRAYECWTCGGWHITSRPDRRAA